MIGFVLLFGCDEAEVPNEQAAPVELVELPAPRLLRRMSLDLRGTLPSVAELDAVEADASNLDSLAAEFLTSNTLEDRLTSLFAERWHTVLDTYEVHYDDYGIPPEQADEFAHSVGEEPLRLLAHVVKNDLPWSEIVTADYTIANELLASIWPIAYPDGQTGWQPSTYTDLRPKVGVLSTNGFYWRYVTNVSNKNRGRAAAISRLLLCDDILARPIVFQRSQSLNPEEAIKTEPTCIACHATVDPIAAGLFGFWWAIQYNPYEMNTYHADRERLGESMLETNAGWYGTNTGGLVDMGWYVSNDARFARCGVESFAEQLWRRPVELSDYEQIESMRLDFEAQGQHPAALILDVLQTPAYRAGAFAADATDAAREREQVERLLSPNQQRMLLEELAGITWADEGYVALENDVYGYRVLGGGVDGYTVTSPQQKPGLTWALVNSRAAQAAAHAIVIRDLDSESPAVLNADSSTAPEQAGFSEAVAALHWRFFAERPSEEWITSIGELWSAVADIEGESQAWEAVIEAMLRDPRMVAY